MKITHVLMTLAFGCLFFACGNSNENSSSETEKSDNGSAEIELPVERSLSPYGFELSAPVTAANLYNEVMDWREGWDGKEISIIAWIGGGMSTGATKRFSQADNPGLIVLKANLLEGEMAKMADIGGKASHIVLKGKARDDGNALMLEEAVIVGPYTDEVPSGQELTLDLSADSPVNPLDVLSSINAWRGVEIAIQDVCSIPMKGNAMTFRNDGQELVRARFTSKFDNKKPVKEVRTLTGTVNRIDNRGTLILSDCAFTE